MISNCYNIEKHRSLFESLGGFPEIVVENTEWLYMLREDTRQSLAIEGYFATEEELEAVLKGGRSTLEITNYFRTAQTMYDQALQYHRDNIYAPLSLPVIRHIHSELFRGLDNRRGEFRKMPIHIQGAKVKPPEYDIEAYLRAAIDLMLDNFLNVPTIFAAARAHALLHPFSDGNGRVGRILLNYLVISKGYPPIVIKGISQEERSRYYLSLETADKGFHQGFSFATRDSLQAQLDEGDIVPLCNLLCEGLLPRLDLITVLAMEKQEPLMDLNAMAARLEVKEGTLRQWILRGKLVAIKRGKKLYSHPKLILY
jgi:fido (protein-threonine AMPylation protein)